MTAARESPYAGWAGTAVNVGSAAVGGLWSFTHGAWKCVWHPQAEAPTVLYNGATNVLHAAQWAGRKALDTVDPAHVVETEIAEIREHPTHVLATAKKVWDKTPSIVKLGASYYLPLGWAMKAPAMAKFAYDALPDRAKEPVRNAVAGITAGLAKTTVVAAASGVEAVVPYVAPTVRGTVNATRAVVTAGASYAANKVAEMAPTPETVADAVQRIKEDPKQVVAVAREAWTAAPPLVKAGMVALAPVSSLVQVPLLAKVAYDALPENAQQPIREAAQGALAAAQEKYPQIRTVVDAAAPVLEQAADAVDKPVVLAGHNINPLVAAQGQAVDAAKPLQAIHDRATQILEFASANRIVEAAPPPEEEQEVEVEAAVGAAPAAPTEAVPAVADPRIVTEATGPQARFEAKNWREEADKNLETLSHNLGNYAVLSYMYYSICGFAEEDGGTSILELVHKASIPVNGRTPDLWDLFCTEYKLKLFSPQWWRCKFFYWTSYKWTSIIPNTVDAYMKEIFGEVRSKLASRDSGQKRAFFIRSFLDQASQFLDAHNGAAKAFAQAVQPNGDLDDYKRRAIVERYGYSPKRIARDRGLQKTLAKRAETSAMGKVMDARPEKHSMHTLQQLGEDYALENLCASFAKRMMSEFSTYVPFFKGTKKIPIIGKPIAFILKPVEWILNGFIWWQMRTNILPAVLKSAVEEGLDAAKPHNLPFAKALTTFFTAQFTKLKGKLTAEKDDSKPVPAIPGTEKLPDVVIKLKRALDLMPHQTQDALKAKLDAMDKGGGALNDTVQNAIRDGIVKGGQVFLEFLTDPANHEEMAANLFDLLNVPFTGSAPRDVAGWAKMGEEFEAQRKDLKREARTVFELIIEEAVEEEIAGLSPEKAAEQSRQSFEAQQAESARTFDQLHYYFERIQEKTAADSADPANSIHPEIAAVATRMKSFSQLQHRLEGLEPAAREGINRVLAPLYVRAEELTARMAALQELQTKFSSHSQVREEFERIHLLLGDIPQQAEAAPRRLKDALPHLESPLRRIAEHLPANAQELAETRQHNQTLARHFEAISKNDLILDGLKRLDPSGAGNPAQRNQGLIYRLANYQRYKRNPEALRRFGLQGFDQGACMKEINKVLAHLDIPEQSRLRAIIRKIELFGTHPVGVDFDGEIWNPLTQEMQQIQQKYAQAKAAQKLALEADLGTFGHYLQAKVEGYRERTRQNHEAMAQEIQEAGEALQALREEIPNVQQEAQVRLNPDQLGFLTGAAGLLACLAFGPVAGAAIGAGAYLAVQNMQGLATDGRAGAILQTVGGTTVAGLAAGALPGVIGAAGGVIGAAAAGSKFTDGAVGAVRENVVPQVMQIFEAAYNLTLSAHISHAAATWGMKAIVDSRPSVTRSVFRRPLTA